MAREADFEDSIEFVRFPISGWLLVIANRVDAALAKSAQQSKFADA